MKVISTLWATPALKRLAFVSLFLLVAAWVQAATWYSKNGTDPSVLSNWYDNSGGTGTNHPSNFNGNDLFIIQSGHTVTIPNNRSLVIGTSSTLQVDGTLAISGNNAFATIDGTIVFTGLSTNQVTLAGAGGGNTITVNGTLKTANTNGISCSTCSLPVSNVAGKKTVTLSTGVNYEFNGATQSTAGLPATVNSLTITNSGIKSLSADVIVTNALTINTAATLNANNRNLTVGGNWVRNGFFTPGTGIVTFNGGNQTITAGDFYNLTFTSTNGGTKTVTGADNLGISRNLTISGANTILDLGNTLADNTTGTGSLTIGSRATLKVGGSGSRILPQNYSSYPFDAASTVEFYGGGTRNILARNYGNLVITGPTTVQANGALNIAGNLTIATADAIFNATNGSALTHQIQGNWTNNGTYNASGNTKFIFNGSTPQTIGGSAQTTFENLEVDNVSGLTLNQTVGIGADGGNGSLTFTKGIITLASGKLLIIYPNPTLSGVSDASHVNGPVRKIGNDAFTFPVGKNGKYAPIAISAPVTGADPTANTFTAEYFPTSGTALGPISQEARDKDLEAVSNCEYWQLDRGAGTTANVDVTLSWGPNRNSDPACTGPGYIKNPFFLVVAHFNGSQWDSFSPMTLVDDESTVRTGDATSGTITWKNCKTFSPFTIGTTDASQAPLPVTFVSFEGRKTHGGTQLTWNVAGETNVKGYDVERRTTGGQFTKIGYVEASGSNTYTFTDASQQKGVVFYRLRNIDGDGRFAYSTILSFKNGTGISVFPTLVSGKTTILHDAAGSNAYITLSTADGKQVKVQKPVSGSVQTQVDLTGLQSGLYLLKYSDGAGSIETVKLMKQ
jgi:hypothetical protein